MSTIDTPFRKMEPPAPRLIAQIPDTGRAGAVALIFDRIQRVNRDHPRAPAYLFVKPDGSAYVLHENQAVLQTWTRDHLAWFVGVYDRRTGKMRPLPATLDGLLEDVAEHLMLLSAAAPA